MFSRICVFFVSIVRSTCSVRITAHRRHFLSRFRRYDGARRVKLALGAKRFPLDTFDEKEMKLG